MQTAAPRTMTVKASPDRWRFNDILLGEVWLCSGPIEHGLAAENRHGTGRKKSPTPTTRRSVSSMCRMPRPPKDRLNVCKTTILLFKKNYCVWRPCSPESASNFSAVAYSSAATFTRRGTFRRAHQQFGWRIAYRRVDQPRRARGDPAFKVVDSV